MWVKSVSMWLPLALASCLFLGEEVTVAAQNAPNRVAAARPAFDPLALQLLQKMAETYAHLPRIDQRTVFYAASIPIKGGGAKTAEATASGGTPAKSPAPIGADSTSSSTSGASPASASNRDANAANGSGDENSDLPGEKLKRSLHLLALRPNQMHLELREYDPSLARDRISQWISDGKTFWTYTEENHQYTKEAAPPRLQDFLKLNHLDTGSLELLMMLGINPFADVRNEVESVGYQGDATVRGVATEVVTLRAVQSTTTTEARLYIGKEDHLLHRLVTESSPAEQPPAPGKVGDELDALVDGRGPAPPPSATPPPQFATSETDVPDPEPAVPLGPMKTVMAYDNIIESVARPDVGAFSFVIPTDAMLYEPLQIHNGPVKPTKPNLAELFRMAGVKKKRHKTRVIKG